MSDPALIVHPLKDCGAFKKLTIENDLLAVDICPEAARILEITNKKAQTGYLRRLESGLPDNARAGGIGDAHYATHWRTNKWEYLEADWHLGGYSHQTGGDADSVWVTVRKDALHDVWRDAEYPGLKVERTTRLRKGSPTVEILDSRTNNESTRHGMVYDLLFCLLPRGGGHVENSLHLPIWCRVQVLHTDGRVTTLGREDFSGRELRQEDVLAMLLSEPDAAEGVLVEFDRPQEIDIRTGVGGAWEGNLFVMVRRPFRLERFEVLERLFKVTPYSLDRQRIDCLFRAGQLVDTASQELTGKCDSALAEALSLTQDTMTRGMLKGVARAARHAIRTGGEGNCRLAKDWISELRHFSVHLAAGREVHHPFFDDAFVADKKALLRNFPFQRDKDALAKEEQLLATSKSVDAYTAPWALMAASVEAVCFDDLAAARKIAELYKRHYFPSVSFQQTEVHSQTISNGNWCIGLVVINEAMGRMGMLNEDELAVTFEILWEQGRIIDDYGCGALGNWGTMERTYLAYLTIIFPQALRRAIWLEKAVECLDVTILGCCSQDGGWPEPPGYTHWGMRKGLELMELLGRGGVLGDKGRQRDEKLRKMAEYQWRIMLPNDALPPVGDAGGGFNTEMYMRFARRYQMRELAAACIRHGWKPIGSDLLFSGTVPEVGKLASRPANRASDHLSHDGYALFRGDKSQLTLFYGYQAGHGHFDTQSFQFFAHGRPFVTENVARAEIAGGCGYGSRFNLEWIRASRSHSTILVDDRTYTQQTPGKCLKWESSDGKAHGIFSAPVYPGVTVTREARQDGKRYTLIDTIAGAESVDLSEADVKRLKDALMLESGGAGKTHTWRALLPGDVELEQQGRVVIARAKEGAVKFDFSKLDADVEIVLQAAPPPDLPRMEEITHYGKMLLLRAPIQPKRVFKVEIEPI